MSLTGGCACGAVRYQISQPPLFSHACHCTDCQRTTGSAFVINLVVVQTDLAVEGDMRAASLPTDSGTGYDLHFCSACATVLWCQYGFHQVPIVAVRAGTLDDTSAIRPAAHIFVRSKQPWVRLDSNVPAFDEGYDRTKAWPAASLERYANLPPK
ncbi:MAG: GFA family protein [Pseudomonadota bacterium]